MKNSKLILIHLYFFILVACQYDLQQPVSEELCDPLDSSKMKVIMKSSNIEMLDISLKLFKHPALDTGFRVWYLSHRVDGIIGTYQLKIFEYGRKKEIEASMAIDINTIPDSLKYYAMYSSIKLEGYGNDDSVWNIKCIKTKSLEPTSGWVEFENKLQNKNLANIFPMPKGENGLQTCNECLLWLQYVGPKETKTLDFTYHLQFSADRFRYPRDRKFFQLVRFINNEFKIKISYDELTGYDQLYLNDDNTSNATIVVDSIK